MKQWRFLLLPILLVAGLSTVAAAEIFRCSLPDGSEIYTNNPADYPSCEAYEPKSELSVFSSTEPAAPPLRLPEALPEPAPSPKVEAPAATDMPFEVFRMLSIGMNETEVLARAGLPTYISSLPLAAGSGLIAPVSNALRYSYIGDWIVVVSFDLSGRVINLDRFRPRP
jgi:hypothetical protein